MSCHVGQKQQVSAGNVGQKRHEASTLDGPREDSLMTRARPRQAGGQNLSPVCDEAADPFQVLVVNHIHLVGAEPANPALKCSNRSRFGFLPFLLSLEGNFVAARFRHGSGHRFIQCL